MNFGFYPLKSHLFITVLIYSLRMEILFIKKAINYLYQVKKLRLTDQNIKSNFSSLAKVVNLKISTETHFEDNKKFLIKIYP
jgi:hypothetical protein